MIKSFSSYGPRDKNNEQNEALNFAKKRNEEYLAKLKKSESFLAKEKEAKKQEEAKLNPITDEQLQKNIKIAEENNKKFSHVLTTNSSLEEILDSLFEKK